MIRNCVIPRLDASVESNASFLMYLCFIIGVVHMTLGHVISAISTINSPRALGEIGWICILWPMFFLAGNLILDKPMPSFAGILFAIGGVLTLIFTNFQKNVLKGIFGTITSLPFSILGSFSDTISYLRLYAVGLAGATVSGSFNDMLLGPKNNALETVIAALFLFLAHALNFILGCMAVIVHGVRLNLLEFSSHSGMVWTGRPYQPFKE